MAASDWRLEGEWIKNCTCAFGCPCDFNALPTEGYCKGMVGMRITKGHFENTKLDGLVFAETVHFPGALHEGNGSCSRSSTSARRRSSAKRCSTSCRASSRLKARCSTSSA